MRSGNDEMDEKRREEKRREGEGKGRGGEGREKEESFMMMSDVDSHLIGSPLSIIEPLLGLSSIKIGLAEG